MHHTPVDTVGVSRGRGDPTADHPLQTAVASSARALALSGVRSAHWGGGRALGHFLRAPTIACRWAIDGLADFHGEARLRLAAARILDPA